MLLAACGARWVETRRAVGPTTGAPALSVFSAALVHTRELGYIVEEVDEARGYFRVRARLDGDVALKGPPGYVRGAVLRVSWFQVQVYADGAIAVTPVGYHVRTNMMRPALGEELDWYVNELKSALTARVVPR